MATTALMAYIQEDLKKYENCREIVKAGSLTRLTKKSAAPEELHPNPEDEFCFPEIGPNGGIVSKYCQEAVRLKGYGETVFPEPIQVAKMKPDGYLILNGHHRWAAALQTAMKKVHIEIVNPRNY